MSGVARGLRYLFHIRRDGMENSYQGIDLGKLGISAIVGNFSVFAVIQRNGIGIRLRDVIHAIRIYSRPNCGSDKKQNRYNI